MRINLYDLGHQTYHSAISFDSGITSSRSDAAFSKNAMKAAGQTLFKSSGFIRVGLLHQPPMGG